jgi:hypothetical protein
VEVTNFYNALRKLLSPLITVNSLKSIGLYHIFVSLGPQFSSSASKDTPDPQIEWLKMLLEDWKRMKVSHKDTPEIVLNSIFGYIQYLMERYDLIQKHPLYLTNDLSLFPFYMNPSTVLNIIRIYFHQNL